jgi:nicotinate-nucleotide--dimethylbenzimidazole phosphoribosyltransferase
LEEIAVALAALQGTHEPAVDPCAITLFAADHGVAREGVSAYPQEVTGQMVRNFVAGGAAISVLARALGARLEVVDVGVATPLADCPTVVAARVAAGTANFVEGPAMTGPECVCALRAGEEALRRAHAFGARLFVGGEMGIGNTTAASALACLLLGRTPFDLVGPGTGLDAAAMGRKRQVVEAGIARHGAAAGDPLACLSRVGGFEIAALVGAYLAAAAAGVPVLVDGFITRVAALTAVQLAPKVAPWFFHAHLSGEPGDRHVLVALGAKPLLDLGLRLGEGSGAALAVPLLRHACALHNEMATFAEAKVAGGMAPVDPIP